jgi:hypothetical protein
LSVSGKLTGTLSDRARVLSQLLSACCVLGAGADFASTVFYGTLTNINLESIMFYHV